MNDLPQRAIAQERRVTLALVRKKNDFLREKFSFALCLIGQVENLANVVERCGHRLNVLRLEHAAS